MAKPAAEVVAGKPVLLRAGYMNKCSSGRKNPFGRRIVDLSGGIGWENRSSSPALQ